MIAEHAAGLGECLLDCQGHERMMASRRFALEHDQSRSIWDGQPA
jgi:hypothetical protein